MGQDSKDRDGHFSNYAEYSKTFRSWMVAYGIGGPILLLTSKDAPQSIAKSPHLQAIVTLFIVGVGIQIFLALINKWAAWHMYKGAYSKHQKEENDPDGDNHHESVTYKFWKWINRLSWIDFCCDVGAVIVFSIATWLILRTLLVSTQ
jgi:hypothetical protein